MATTAGDQINRALRLLGVLAEGETPSAEVSQDALIALNQMMEMLGLGPLLRRVYFMLTLRQLH